jgi:mono/diheme cytochrome c family protein
MDFPVWRLGAFGGGFWIVLIAVLHVCVAYFAVGGGLFLVATEIRARRLGSRSLLAYGHGLTRFFLLLTMVFGALSGVGIWLVITVLSPQATLLLVRALAWGWATEWTFFAGEIAALLVYYYGYDRLDARRHLAIGWLYFLFAFLSLFVINGLVGFMLTPGRWPETLDFWDGLFNPSFWPSLVLRFALGSLLAGLVGIATGLGIPDVADREAMLRFCRRYVLAVLPVLAGSAFWYLGVLPEAVRDFVLRRSPEAVTFGRIFVWLLVAVGVLTVGLAARLPRGVRRSLAVVLLLAGLGLVGSFETIREAARKPWLVSGLIWSTDIRAGTVASVHDPILSRATWAKVHEATPANRLMAGRELFALECLACHSIGGPIRDIRKYTAHIGAQGVEAFLTGQGKLFTQMPPFLGSAAEREALAAYIAEGINGQAPQPAKAVAVEPAEVDIPSFDPDKATHVLVAVNSLGVVAMAGCDGSFSLTRPGNTLSAVLVKRDVLPEVVTENVTLDFAAPKGFAHPSARLDFWKYARSLVGKPLPPDVSATGLGPSGRFTVADKLFTAVGIPVSPYPDTGGVNPYPVFSVAAKDAKTGETLAATKAVLPVSTEMGCATCHGGTWAVDGTTGVAKDTARSILAVHDRRNHTDLASRAASGQPVACQSCHPDVGAEGTTAGGLPELLGLSAAIHGFHASYLTGSDAAACSRCHPTAPNGLTQAQRDNHAAAGIGCPRCHGFLEDHALSLLLHEQAAGKKAAAWLMGPLRPRSLPQVSAIVPRAAWIQEPDCLTCHQDFKLPAKDASAFNIWTKDAAGLFRNRKEDTGNIPCAACHGSPHATSVSVNDYGLDVNNIVPMQYMGAPGVLGSNKRCDVCHTVEMEGDAHHPNMAR